MMRGNVDRAERAVDMAAAAIFAASAGFSLWALTSSVGGATAAAAAAFLAARFGLGRIVPVEPAFALPEFPVETIETDHEAVGEMADELILEDALAEVGPHARVVRLFGPSQSHLPSSHPRAEPPDASEALIEALAELRRSLR